MFDDRYVELERLRKRKNIGIILKIIFTIMLFGGPFAITYYPNLINNIKEPEIYVIAYIVIIIILFAIVSFKLSNPYTKYKNNLTSEIKNLILKQELNNTFNNTYKEEDPETMAEKLMTLKLNIYNSRSNDCFSARYNNVKFTCCDLWIYHHSDDSNVTDFQGPLFEFDLKYQLDGDLYIATKQKVLIGHYSILDGVFREKNCKEVKPSNSILNENIIIKSNTNPSIIENSSFQQIINELMTRNNYIFIYKNNKLYVLIYNNNDSFEIQIRNKEDEIKANEQIRTQVNTIRSELDTLIKYKDILNIKDDTF